MKPKENLPNKAKLKLSKNPERLRQGEIYKIIRRKVAKRHHRKGNWRVKKRMIEIRSQQKKRGLHGIKLFSDLLPLGTRYSEMRAPRRAANVPANQKDEEIQEDRRRNSGKKREQDATKEPALRGADGNYGSF